MDSVMIFTNLLKTTQKSPILSGVGSL